MTRHQSISRRSALGVAVASGATLIAGCAPGGGAAAGTRTSGGTGGPGNPPPEEIDSAWGKLKAILPADGGDAAQVAVTRAGRTLSVGFNDFRIDLGDEQAPLTQTRAFGFEVPLDVPDDVDLLGYVQDLRGTVERTGEAGVLILVDLAGTSVVADYPALGNQGGGPDEEERHSIDRSAFTLDRRPAKWRLKDPSGFPPPRPYTVSLLVSVRRRRPTDKVMVQIVSLDVTAEWTQSRSGGAGQPADAGAPVPAAR